MILFENCNENDNEKLKSNPSLYHNNKMSPEREPDEIAMVYYCFKSEILKKIKGLSNLYIQDTDLLPSK